MNHFGLRVWLADPWFIHESHGKSFPPSYRIGQGNSMSGPRLISICELGNTLIVSHFSVCLCNYTNESCCLPMWTKMDLSRVPQSWCRRFMGVDRAALLCSTHSLPCASAPSGPCTGLAVMHVSPQPPARRAALSTGTPCWRHCGLSSILARIKGGKTGEVPVPTLLSAFLPHKVCPRGDGQLLLCTRLAATH